MSDVPVIAYFRGDDGYSMDRAADAIAERIAADVGGTPDRWRATGAETSPAQIGERVATAPLFGGGTLAIVTDPMPLLRCKADREALERRDRQRRAGQRASCSSSRATAVASGPRRSQALEAQVRAQAATTPSVQGAQGGAARGVDRATGPGSAGSRSPTARRRSSRRASAGSSARATSTGSGQGALAVGELEKLASTALRRP